MKKIHRKIALVLIISCSLLISCSSFIYKEMERIGLDIINEPDRLLKLEIYYPEYYIDSILFKDIKDTIYLKGLRNYMKNEFSKKALDIEIYKVYTHRGYLKIYKKAGYKYELHPDSIYCITLCKDNDCIDLRFIKSNGNYYFFDIGKNILNPHPHK